MEPTGFRSSRTCATSKPNRRTLMMKSFWLNGCSGRQERWAEDGHRWVAAEPRKNGFALWGYQDDRPEIIYLGGDTREEQLEKLADQFLLGDPETIKRPIFSQRRFRYTLPHGGAELSPSGGARKGAGRKRGKRTSDTQFRSRCGSSPRRRESSGRRPSKV
jgi:hypothetical protein